MQRAAGCRAPSQARVPPRATFPRAPGPRSAKPSRRGTRASSPCSACRRAVAVVRGSPRTRASPSRGHLPRGSCRRERAAPLQWSSRPRPCARPQDSLRPMIVRARTHPVQRRSSRGRPGRRPDRVPHRSRGSVPRSPRAAGRHGRSRPERGRPFHSRTRPSRVLTAQWRRSARAPARASVVFRRDNPARPRHGEARRSGAARARRSADRRPNEERRGNCCAQARGGRAIRVARRRGSLARQLLRARGSARRAGAGGLARRCALQGVPRHTRESSRASGSVPPARE